MNGTWTYAPLASTEKQARCFMKDTETLRGQISGIQQIFIDVWYWMAIQKGSTRSTGEHFCFKKVSVNLVSKRSLCISVCICWVANEVAPLPGPLPGRLCSLAVLREDMAADPLLQLAQGAGPRTVTQQKRPCGCPMTWGATTLSRGHVPLYLSLLVDRTVPGLGPPWFSSSRFRAFDLGFGAPSDLDPPSSERPGWEGRITGQRVITIRLPRDRKCLFLLVGYWYITGTEAGRMMIKVCIFK